MIGRNAITARCRARPQWHLRQDPYKLDVLRWHEPRVAATPTQHAAEVMDSDAGLQPIKQGGKFASRTPIWLRVRPGAR